MNTEWTPAPEDIQQLKSLYEAAAETEILWDTHHPQYPDQVTELMQYILSSPWCNNHYPAGKMREIFSSIENASLTDIRSMLTAIARGERFTTGHWKSAIDSGRLKSVITQLSKFQ